MSRNPLLDVARWMTSMFCPFACFGGLTVTAVADEYPLTESLDGKATGNFGVVRITEDGAGGLLFDVALDPGALGAEADLHRLYFNLSGTHSNLGGVTDDDYHTAYELVVAPPVAGGAGTKFDYAVDFGKGASKRGNGTLQHATFRLFENGASDLSLSDVLEESRTGGGSLFHVAVHVQSGEYSAVGGSWTAPAAPEPDPVPAEESVDSTQEPDPCGVFTCVPTGL